MNENIEEINEIRSKMLFFGYSAKNLDSIAAAFEVRFEREPPAFLAKSPFGIHGCSKNKKKLIVSKKHGAANVILVSMIYTRPELENAIFALGETNQKIYVARRKAAELQQRKEEVATLTYEKHCTYCGQKYNVNVDSPKPTCGKNSCIIKHKEYLGMKRKPEKKEIKTKDVQKEKDYKLPDFNLDDPGHNSLQGYIYCVRAENGLCKIGRSSDPEYRFQNLITMSPVDLFLDHTIFSDNYVLAESYIHSELKPYRHHGEWFDLPDSVYNWIISLDNYELDEPTGG